MTPFFHTSRQRTLFLGITLGVLLLGLLVWKIAGTQSLWEPTGTPSTASQAEGTPVDLPREYTFTASEAMTAEELLNSQAEVEYQDFGPGGKFVQSINGLASDEMYFWGFYVNDEFAQAGVSQTQLQPNDTIRFTYEKIEPLQ
ncbi:DUF4430 domain-containing protein [Candidatus Woesebacteria bacterium]|nr:DUF4430 domain-containing protein [Candidatus Woesebacteria bacterium]MCD8507565.1 DUF4430 domain-containing protein [Candidatus Woesebacteria bacterium]MCD8527406.1 DUF4430 domain-containing protein [Candidatus Woesebacteria bacterium]MCD8546152.1 DUF4430 domain-containing protein [Candidatus Woesebacteria bacterium]